MRLPISSHSAFKNLTPLMGDVYDILDNDMKHRLTFLKTSPIIEQTWADPGICHKADYNLGNCSIIQLIAGKATEGQGWG